MAETGETIFGQERPILGRPAAFPKLRSRGHLTLLQLRLCGAVSGKSNWERILGKRLPAGRQRGRYEPLSRRWFQTGEASDTPARVLENNTIAIRVFEGPAVLIPISIESRDCHETRSFHPIHRRLPFFLRGQVENQEVIMCRGSASDMAVGSCKLEMIWSRPAPEHDPVEAIVIFEPVEDI